MSDNESQGSQGSDLQGSGTIYCNSLISPEEVFYDFPEVKRRYSNWEEVEAQLNARSDKQRSLNIHKRLEFWEEVIEFGEFKKFPVGKLLPQLFYTIFVENGEYDTEHCDDTREIINPEFCFVLKCATHAEIDAFLAQVSDAKDLPEIKSKMLKEIRNKFEVMPRKLRELPHVIGCSCAREDYRTYIDYNDYDDYDDNYNNSEVYSCFAHLRPREYYGCRDYGDGDHDYNNEYENTYRSHPSRRAREEYNGPLFAFPFVCPSCRQDHLPGMLGNFSEE